MSLIVSEALFLAWLWRTAIGLSIGSFSLLMVLVVCRWFSDRRIRRQKRRQQQLSQHLYASLTAPVAPEQTTPLRLSRQDRRLLTPTALECLRNIRGDDQQKLSRLLLHWGMLPHLRKAAKRGRRGRRIQAIALLGYFDLTESRKTLMSLMAAADMYIQTAALRSLARQEVSDDLPQILQQLARSRHGNQPMLADILQTFGERASSLLVQLAQSAENLDTRLAAVQALGSIRSLQAVEPLIRLAADSSPAMRCQALQALTAIGDPRAGAVAQTALADEDSAVRQQAAIAIGKLQWRPAMRELMERLNDPHWWVRFRAAEALYSLGEPGVALLRSVQSVRDAAGIIAEQVLAEKGGMHA